MVAGVVPVGNICQHLKTFLVVTTVGVWAVSLVSSGQRSGIGLNILQCKDNPSPQRISQPKTSIVLRVRNPDQPSSPQICTSEWFERGSVAQQLNQVLGDFIPREQARLTGGKVKANTLCHSGPIFVWKHVLRQCFGKSDLLPQTHL